MKDYEAAVMLWEQRTHRTSFDELFSCDAWASSDCDP